MEKVIQLGGYNSIFAHKSAIDEMNGFFKNNQNLFSLLDKRLIYLDEHIDNPYQHREWFERLDFTYSSMRFNRMKILGNLRIIFCIVDFDAYLLYAFQEKNKSDYRKALEISRVRIKDIRR